MKKNILSLFVALSFLTFFSVLNLSSIVKHAVAAGETYTWNGANIQVTGGTLGNGQFVPNTITQIPETTFRFPNNANCSIITRLFLADDKKSARMTAMTVAGAAGPQGPATPRCPAELVNQFNGITVNIGGKAPTGCAQETPETRTLRIIISSPDGDKAPANLTINVGGSKEKVSSDGVATYERILQVDPGSYEICAPPVLKKCETVEKKCGQLVVTLGESESEQLLTVNLKVKILAWAGQKCKIPGYTLELKKGNKVVKTAKTADRELTPTQQEKDLEGFGGLRDTSFTMVGKFTGVTDGTYQVCVKGTDQCQEVKKEKDKNVVPNEVSFDITVEDSSKICTGSGDDYETPWPTNPPPPSPPCAKFENGECQEVFSAFGNVSTTPSNFITKVFGILLSSAGGLALFLIMRAGYIIMTSRGKPEQLQNGRDQFIAAVVGLMFLIFSFVILQVIGTDILKLPQDTKTGGDKDTGAAAVISNVGGPCGRASGAQCANGLTCNITADTSQACRNNKECSGICER